MVYGGLGDCNQLMMYGIVFHPMGKADAVAIVVAGYVNTALAERVDESTVVIGTGRIPPVA